MKREWPPVFGDSYLIKRNLLLHNLLYSSLCPWWARQPALKAAHGGELALALPASQPPLQCTLYNIPPPLTIRIVQLKIQLQTKTQIQLQILHLTKAAFIAGLSAPALAMYIVQIQIRYFKAGGSQGPALIIVQLQYFKAGGSQHAWPLLTLQTMHTF